MNIIEALAPLGIAPTETVRGRVVTTNILVVPVDRERELNADILRINGALQKHGLLNKWRAKKGGTTTERWVLVVGRP